MKVLDVLERLVGESPAWVSGWGAWVDVWGAWVGVWGAWVGVWGRFCQLGTS